MFESAISARKISKCFGRVRALDEVSIEVAQGSVLGLLGRNGAGKTTLVEVLCTILPPSGGSATVAGFDVQRQASGVRSRIGLTGQFAAVDDQLSGLANLVLVARLLGAGRRQARARAEELLELFGLTDAAHRWARGYSGGMRRRLDLAVGLVGRPDVVFLDEPTTGLDPASRRLLWELIEDRVREGAAVLLTTQYLEEADRLADAITVLSGGKVHVSGTPAELKARVGSRSVHLRLREGRYDEAMHLLGNAGLCPALDADRGELVVPVEEPAELATVVRAVDAAGVDVVEVTLSEPTLDDVFLSLTGTTAAPGAVPLPPEPARPEDAHAAAQL